MSDAHKQAIARGREATTAVRRYLDTLETQRSQPGRRRTPAAMQKRMAQIDAALGDANSVSRLLTQERLSLAEELAAAADGTPARESVEADFVRLAKSFADAKGISYQAWRAVGVSPRVLRAAGIRK